LTLSSLVVLLPDQVLVLGQVQVVLGRQASILLVARVLAPVLAPVGQLGQGEVLDSPQTILRS
jgi:hypothetical protein